MYQLCRKSVFANSRWCCEGRFKKCMMMDYHHYYMMDWTWYDGLLPSSKLLYNMMSQHFCSALNSRCCWRFHSISTRDSRANGFFSHGSMYLHSSWMAQGGLAVGIEPQMFGSSWWKWWSTIGTECWATTCEQSVHLEKWLEEKEAEDFWGSWSAWYFWGKPHI